LKVPCYINDYSTEALVNSDSSESVIDERIVLDLLKKGAIDRNDFQGDFESIMVDDHIAENTILMLDKIRLGELVINHSMARVKKDTGQYFVIGSEALVKAGSYQVDIEKGQLIYK